MMDIFRAFTAGAFSVLIGVVACRWWSAASSS